MNSEVILEEIQRVKDIPNVRAFLDMIAKAEGTSDKGDNGYNVRFGHNTTFDSYDAHPKKYTKFVDKKGTTRSSSASGRYQIISSTADNLNKVLGKSDFSPETQDEMALLLIMQKNALNDIINGDIETAIDKLGGVWASLPSSNYKDTQGYKSKDFVLDEYNKALENYTGKKDNNTDDIIPPINYSVVDILRDQINNSGGIRRKIGRQGQREILRISPDPISPDDPQKNFRSDKVTISTTTPNIYTTTPSVVKQDVSVFDNPQYTKPEFNTDDINDRLTDVYMEHIFGKGMNVSDELKGANLEIYNKIQRLVEMLPFEGMDNNGK